MPSAPHKVPVSIRVDREQHERWMRAAKADDRSLAKWIARLCDAATADKDVTGHGPAWYGAARQGLARRGKGDNAR